MVINYCTLRNYVIADGDKEIIIIKITIIIKHITIITFIVMDIWYEHVKNCVGNITLKSSS